MGIRDPLTIDDASLERITAIEAERARVIDLVRGRLTNLIDGRDAPTRGTVTIALDQIITAIRRGEG